MINLKDKPFCLNREDGSWVEKTLENMSLDEKVGQLFCPMGLSGKPGYLKHLIEDQHIAGLLYRPAGKKEIQETYRYIQNHAKIPMLLAANTEAGGDGISFEGTSLGKPMSIAATDNVERAYQMGKVACKEGAALGMNWAFAPIVDIDRNFHNPITNIRTFGSSPEKVLQCASEYLRAADEENVAVAIKHFPGDGCDERDQHLLTSINDCSTAKWDATYGKIYKTLIEQGAKTVMAGHIALPAYVKLINQNATVEECLYPASLSKELIMGLLRGKLGFNGLVSTDATPMVGFSNALPRSKAIPASVNAGCDIILFNKDLEEDISFILAAIKEGTLTIERVDEAVTRTLAVKASLGLHRKQAKGQLVPSADSLDIIGCQKHKDISRQIADESVTLVRDKQSLLPLSIENYKRLYLNVVQKDTDLNNPLVQEWKNAFEKEGFEVAVRDRSIVVGVENLMGQNVTQEIENRIHEMYRSIDEFKTSCDLYVYIGNVENESNNTTTRLNWNVAYGLGDDLPWFVQEKPTLFISVANPYHLFDVPMIKTYINAYDNNAFIREAVMDKIMGRSTFKGVSPIDPYCGNKYISGEF